MAAKLERPKLTRDRLGENGIYYHEKVYGKPDTAPILSIPDHVNNLRVVLLDFSDIQIINNWKRAFSKEKTIVQPLHRPRGIDESDWDLEPPESSYIHPEDLHELRRDWKNEEIAIASRNLHSDAESGWMDFFRSNFFKRFKSERDEFYDLDCVYFDEFSLEENVLWSEVKNTFQSEENFDPKINALTGPKPDLSYGFKANLRHKIKGGFSGMHYFQNLTFDVLGELRAKTPHIQSTVTSKLSDWHEWQANRKNKANGKYYSGKLFTQDFLCFPWAVVEAKHAQSTMSAEEYCQCQLANATACAYDFQERLVRSVSDVCPVDPIIGFTCIGPRVKLWLTFRGDDNKLHMVCIWATSLDYTWGVLTLTEVINHMQQWASRILRGKIAQYIDWAYRMPSITPKAIHSSGEALDLPTVVSTAKTSSTATASNGNADITRATHIFSMPSNPRPIKKVRIRQPSTPDSTSTAAETSSDAGDLARATRDATDTSINEALNASSTLSPQDSGTSKTSVADGRKTPPTDLGTASASPPASSHSSPIANNTTANNPKSSVNTPKTDVLGTFLSNAPDKAGGPMTFEDCPGGASWRKQNIIPSGRVFNLTFQEASASKTPSFFWDPLTLANINFNEPSSPLRRSEKPASSTATQACATPQHKPAPTSPFLPSIASDTTTAPPTSGSLSLPRKKPDAKPQDGSLSPPKQPLRGSRSESNLSAKAQGSASARKFTIFDRLAKAPTTSQTGSKDRPDLPQDISYPSLPAHTRSVSSEEAKNSCFREQRQGATSDAKDGADTKQTPK